MYSASRRDRANRQDNKFDHIEFRRDDFLPPRDGSQTVDAIPTRSANFEVALFEVPCDKLVEKLRNYHNPTRQRGICWHAAETPKVNPSLTFRVVIVGNAQLQNWRFGLV